MEPAYEPTLVLEAPSVCCYTCASVFLMFWRDAPSDATVDDVHAAMQAFVDRAPTGISVLSVIERGATPPSPQNRARIAAFQAQLGGRLKRLVLCIDGVGFIASIALAAATSIISERKTGFSQSIVRTPEAAADRLLRDPEVAARFSRRLLLAAIAGARGDASRRAPAGARAHSM